MDNAFLNALMARHTDDCAEAVVVTVAVLAKQHGWDKPTRQDIAGVIARLVCDTVSKTAALMMEIDAAK